MSGMFGGGKVATPKASAPAPKIADTDMTARKEKNRVRERQGADDNALTLGRTKTPGSDTTSLLG